MKILIYNSGGGLGDSIQLFDLITTLKEKCEKTFRIGLRSFYHLDAQSRWLNY